MTVNEHVFAIKNLLNKGVASDDSRITNSLILHYLNISRSLLIKRKLDKDHNISDHTYTSICVPLEVSTYHDCSCIEDKFECNVLKSKCKLPSDIITRWGASFMVKTINGKQLSKISMTQNEYAKHSLSGADKEVGWIIENGHLIILNNLTLPLVIVKGIWQSPEKLDNFCECGSNDNELEPCYDSSTDEFPIDPELILPMYDLTMERIRQAYNFPEDNENNTRDTQVINEQE